MGESYGLKGDYEEALRCFERAVETQPNCAWAWHGKGLALEALGREEAEEAFAEAERLGLDEDRRWW